MSTKKEKALKTKSVELPKITNPSQMERQSFTQTEMTEYYRLITSELTGGKSPSKQWKRSTKRTWPNQKTTEK